MNEIRWVCGKGYDEKYILVELRGRTTDCYFWVDTKWDEGKSHRAAGRITGHANRISKEDKRLHMTRGEAINKMLADLRDERTRLSRRLTEIADEINIVDTLDVGKAA